MTKIYLAGPFFSETQIEKVERLEKVLTANKTVKSFFSPHLHQENEYEKFSVNWGKEIYKSDMNALKDADTVVAIIDFDGNDCDSGTAFELGVAEIMDKHIVLIQEQEIETNLMLSGSCDYHVTTIEDLKDYDFNTNTKNEFSGIVF